MDQTSKHKKIYFLMVLGTIFWAGAFIAGKISVNEFPPFSLAFFRFLIASFVIYGVMYKYETKDYTLRKKDLPIYVSLGLIGMFGYHVLFFISLKYTSAVNASMIAATNPLMTTVLASFLIKERLGIKKILSILLSLSGVMLVITGGSIEVIQSFGYNIGDLIMIIAVLCWAVYSVMVKRVVDNYSPLILTTYSFIVCTIALVPFVIYEKPLTYMRNTSLVGWVAVIYMAIFPSVIGYLIQQVSIKSIGASRTSIFINLVPVFSIILSTIFLNESITSIKVVGALLIIAGVYSINRGSVKAIKRKAEANHSKT